jgi:chromosome segregation ATPase
MEFSTAQQIYTNGFFSGSGLGYQNGHLEGYNMAATEAHAVIAQRDIRVAQLEAMLRAAHHESSQKSDEDAKIMSNMDRQWTAESRVATDRLDELICARAEVLDLKDEYDEYENKMTVNAEWLIHDLQASRRACNKWETSCRKAETKVIQLEDICDDLKKTVGQLLLGDPERPRESQLRGDPLIEQEYQKSVQELHANLDFSEKELEEARTQAEAEKEKFLREISELTFEAEKMHDHSEMVSASHERFQKVYLATTVRCDELILKVRDLERENTNQENELEEVTDKLEKVNEELEEVKEELEESKDDGKVCAAQLRRARDECRIEAKACREAKQLCNELNEESRSYKEDVDALKMSCERYKESMDDDRQALWGLNTLNQKLLDGIVSAGKWLGKDNQDAFKMMLVRGGAPEDVIDEAL